jgi:hypothetical protein
MREMLPDIEIVLSCAYICSDCGSWNFPLSRLSDLADSFQQKNAGGSLSDHDCGTSRRTIKNQNRSNTPSSRDSRFTPKSL